MAAHPLPRPAACPACVVPLPETGHAAPPPRDAIILSLPTIHCAACISAVERRLNAAEGVRSARVNLSLKRVAVETSAELSPDALIRSLATIGYEAHELDAALLSGTADDRLGRNLLMRLAVAGFAMMNVMLLSVAVWSGAEAATRDFMHWISALIALPAIAFAAQPFFGSALAALKVGRLNMDVPISLAILLAAAMSLYETSQSGQHAYFDAALSLTFFLLAGRYLDHRTRASARSAAQELAALEVPRAIRLEGGKETIVNVGELAPGDRVLVRPGTRIPVDGRVLNGESEIDRAFLTGECLPDYVGPGSVLAAGEINLTGALTCEVTALARNSTLQKVADLVALAETARNRYTSLADRAAAIYAPGVHLLAALAFLAWLWISGDFRLALNIAIAVLIITCPCALGLAVPAVTTAASGRLFRKGVLLKSATALERLAETDIVVFDKTGTLTLGHLRLIADPGIPPEALAAAQALAQHSAHPLAVALANGADSANLPPLTDIREIPGHGIRANLNGREISLGRAAWVEAVAVPETATYLRLDDQPPIAFRFQDEIRPGVSELVSRLKSMGQQIQMLTGDNRHAAADIAERLGIETFRADATPEIKADAIANLTGQGHKVLMVGDGLNDTAALTQAHVSISPASAIDAARTASDIVILGQDFSAIADCRQTAVDARRRIVENFSLAALYNLIAVPFALFGFATPLMAALAMSASSITVTLNAWRLR